MWRGIGKDAEENCILAFQHYLEDQFSVRRMLWEAGDEPPDRYMCIQDRRYAVEVSTLIASVPVLDVTKRPLPGIHAIHERLVEETERIALELGILDGAYSVCFIRSIVNRPELEGEVSDFILDFVRRTNGDDTSEPRSFYSSNDYRPLVLVAKHHRKHARLFGTPPPIVASDVDLHCEARRILADRVTDKIRRLQGLPSPKILLLLNATLLIDSTVLLSCPVQRVWEESIDAAMLISGENEVAPLWSRIVNW